MKSNKNKQNGVGMIEVLITILITAVGLMGVAKMQTMALKSNHDAAQRSMAIYYAEDIVSRMRSLPVAICNIATHKTELKCVNAGGIWSPVNYLADYIGEVGGGSISSEPSPNCDSSSNVCTIPQKVAHDLWEWEQLLDGETEKSGVAQVGGLLNVDGCIDVTSNQIKVRIAWDALDSADNLATADACGNNGDGNFKRRQFTVYAVK